MNNKVIITVCPSQVHNGVWRHLKELEQFGTVHYDVNDQIPMDVDVIIFGGAWNTKYAEINREAKSKKVRTGLLFCSPFGQASLSNEICHLALAYELMMDGIIDYLFTGTKEMAEVYKNHKVMFLPQTINWKKFLKDYDKNTEIMKNTVGLFCSKAWHKNILNQLLSLKRTEYQLMTNALDNETTKQVILHNIRYTSFGWVTEEEYYNLLKKIPIHLQCSFSEAFDYVVADTLLLDRPILVGPTIDWIKDLNLIVKNIDSPFEIKNAIAKLELKEYEKGYYRAIVIEELDKRAKIAQEVLDRI